MTPPASRTHLRRLRGAAFALLLIASTSGAAELPKVRLIATGGTIANRAAGRLTHEQLVQSVPSLARIARVESEQFSNVSSDALTPDEWLQLSRRINDLFARDPSLAGIVITTGTDTLEETAYFLNLTVTDPRPVVLVGSMRTPAALGYDGAANLFDAVRVAVNPEARGLGVLVVLNGEINAAREVTKADAQRLDAFQTRRFGSLGVIDPDRVVFYRAVVKRNTSRAEWNVARIRTLPRVDILMVYQGAPADLIRSAVDLGARGLVIAGAGAGSTSGTQNEGIAYATQKGVIVVISTRTGAGRVAPAGVESIGAALSDAAAGDRRLIVGGEDLAPLKARILLMLALTKGGDPAEIQRIFSEY